MTRDAVGGSFSDACMERFPPELTGWRLITVEGEECFFTITGRLFTSQ